MDPSRRIDLQITPILTGRTHVHSLYNNLYHADPGFHYA